MLEHIFITGDNHGVFTRYHNIDKQYWNDKTGIIVLGDFSINFYLNKIDEKKKKELMNNYPFYFYLVRGNHECRPQDLNNIKKIFDENVHGIVYYEPKYPRIRYFLDYGLYDISGYNCYVIGGAYSIDKYYRLERAMMTEETNDPKKSGWFSNEQLTKDEMIRATEQLYNFKDMGKHIHFIFSHTCPYSWEPKDLFLSFINQSTVDNTMERWMDNLKEDIPFDAWCFGHFHADRIERPHVEQYFNKIDNLNNIYNRWDTYDKTKKLDWWLEKSPNFYTED